MRHRHAATFIFVIATVIGFTSAKGADYFSRRTPGEDIFNNKTVLRIRIEISTNGLEALGQDPRSFVGAKIHEGSNLWEDVGIHLKGGEGSFQPLEKKPAFTLSFDKFTAGQRFHGLKKIHLNNSVQDPSYLCENICGELYRRSGVPAPRASYATVTLNGKDRGFYVLKEGVNKDFLGIWFTNRNGNLYDGGFIREITEALERDPDADDVDDRSDLKALVDAAREPNLTKRFVAMNQVLDMDRFLTFLALQVMTWDWDGYAMNRNNYRIYHNPDNSKLVFLPQGMDRMFWETNHSIVPHPNRVNGLVARALMDTPEGQKHYRERFAAVFASTFQIEMLTNRVDELAALIRPHAGNDYSNHVNRIRSLIMAQHTNFEKRIGAN